jgi:hypothetical protein
MGKLIIIFCLLPSMLANAQIVDWKHFDEKIMNDVLFNRINMYTKSTQNGDSLIRSLSRMPLGKNRLSLIDNKYFYGLDGDRALSVDSCNNYQVLAERYITNKLNNPNQGSRFYLDGLFKNKVKVIVSSHYKKKSKLLDITFLYIYDVD